MQLWVGLGNPGAQYAGHRHNIGFMAIDAIADRHAAGPWRVKFQGQLAEARIGAGKIWLLKPQTFMNLSGQSVGEAMRFHKLTPADVVVFHDELDLAPGRLRMKAGGGHAGHNGLRSITQHIGDGFRRVRLGIGHPGHKDRVAGYVLSDFAKADQDWLAPLLDEVARAADHLSAGDDARFQSAVMQALTPQRPGKPAPEVAKAAPEPQPEAPAASKLDQLLARFRR
ncbi:aminoacyl-tRNA hydrolase [Paracoccus sp. p4-l81]|uniref:aminoacyl-tRNA hydrolase n=1 Tax=unclassified Paracoccus (in: a-proteobacteria) TaxID=2688777 RepID=UPI0035BB990A